MTQAMRQNLTLSLNQPAVPQKTEGRKVRVRDVTTRRNYDRRAQPRGFSEGQASKRSTTGQETQFEYL
jgi:hypothetical protein